jgi:hypothetical protein
MGQRECQDVRVPDQQAQNAFRLFSLVNSGGCSPFYERLADHVQARERPKSVAAGPTVSAFVGRVRNSAGKWRSIRTALDDTRQLEEMAREWDMLTFQMVRADPKVQSALFG